MHRLRHMWRGATVRGTKGQCAGVRAFRRARFGRVARTRVVRVSAGARDCGCGLHRRTRLRAPPSLIILGTSAARYLPRYLTRRCVLSGTPSARALWPALLRDTYRAAAEPTAADVLACICDSRHVGQHAYVLAAHARPMSARSRALSEAGAWHALARPSEARALERKKTHGRYIKTHGSFVLRCTLSKVRSKIISTLTIIKSTIDGVWLCQRQRCQHPPHYPFSRKE